MPLSERGVLELKCADGGGGNVDLLLLRWPAGGGRMFLAVPMKVCAQGLILAVPVKAPPPRAPKTRS